MGAFGLAPRLACRSASAHQNGVLVGPRWLEGLGLDCAAHGEQCLRPGHVYNQILDNDRSHWRVLPGQAGRLSAGPNNTVMVPATNVAVIQMNSAGKVLRRSPPLPVWQVVRAPDGSEWGGGNGSTGPFPTGVAFEWSRRRALSNTSFKV